LSCAQRVIHDWQAQFAEKSSGGSLPRRSPRRGDSAIRPPPLTITAQN
jgi:hypothetical protein